MDLEIEWVNCNLCGEDNTRLVFKIDDSHLKENKTFDLVQCNNCGLIYLNPRPTRQEINRYYPNEEYYSYSQLEKEESQKKDIIIRLKALFREAVIYNYYGKFQDLSWIQKLKNKILSFPGRYRFGMAPSFIKKGKILDVGCGDGLFLYSLRKLGWQTLGVEINKAASQKARERGLDVLNCDLLEADLDNDFFDVVRMWSVLEHLHNPAQTLAEIYRILKPGGTLIVQVPNFNSLASRLFKENWSGLDVPRHLYQFSSHTLKRIIERNKLIVKKIYCSSVGTIVFSLRIEKIYFLVRPISIIFDYFLDKLGLEDCIVAFAQKRNSYE